MSAPDELVVFGGMALTAVAGRQVPGERKALMFHRVLIELGAVTVVAGDVVYRMLALGILMDDGRGFAAVTLHTFPGRPDEVGSRL